MTTKTSSGLGRRRFIVYILAQGPRVGRETVAPFIRGAVSRVHTPLKCVSFLETPRLVSLVI